MTVATRPAVRLWEPPRPGRPSNADTATPRAPRKLPTFLRKNEIDRLLCAADRRIAQQTYGKCQSKRIACNLYVYRAAQQDRLIVLLGSLLGLRQQEMAGLQVEHINLIDRDVFVCV